MTPVLTVGITTRDRPEALRRALASLATISALAPEVLVFDDGSSVPAASSLAGEPLAAGVRFIRDADAPGYIAGRNRIAASASAGLLLLMDDDAALLPNAAVERAIEVMRRDTQVAAIAFAQAEPDGRPWPERMQPARGARHTEQPVQPRCADLDRANVRVHGHKPKEQVSGTPCGHAVGSALT